MTRNELRQVYRLRMRIAQQEEYLIGLRELKQSTERSLSPGGNNPQGSKRVESIVIKIVSAEEKLQWLYEQLDVAKSALRACITAAISDRTLQRVLILRYVECLTWTEISKATELSRQWVYQLHKKYLETLALHVKC